MLSSYLLEISKINVCVIRLNSIAQNRSRCLYNDVPTVANSSEALVKKFKLSPIPYSPCCLVCDVCASSGSVRSWKLYGSRVKQLQWSPASKRNPSVVVVRFFRSNVRPGVATLYPTKHKCIHKKTVDSDLSANDEGIKQRGLSEVKIKSEMRKIAFKIQKDQWTKKSTEASIVRSDELSIKTNLFTLPAPKLYKTSNQNDKKVLFESKSLKELKERITKKKPKKSLALPHIPVGIRLTASSSSHIQTSGIPSRYVLLPEPNPKQKDNETSIENKAFTLPSPYFFIQQAFNKESLRGTFSDPSLVKETKNKNKKTEEKVKDNKENIALSHTPSPRLLASEKEGGSTDINVLRRQIENAILKYTLPQKTPQDILGTIALTKEEPMKNNSDQKNSSFPSPNLKHSGVLPKTRKNVSRSSSHMWPDESAFNSSAREANPPKKMSHNEITAGYDDYLRKTDKGIRQKRFSKTVTKEVVVFKDDKNVVSNKPILTKETSNGDQPKKLSSDSNIINNPSSINLKENEDKNKPSSNSYGENFSSVSNVNNSFSNVIKENQSTNALQKSQDNSPFLEKPLNNIPSLLKKDMHSRSSNSEYKSEKGNMNEWELQIHSNKKPQKVDDRQNESVENYIVAEEGLPSGKRVLHLYSKRVLEVSSPVINPDYNKTQTDFKKFREDEEIYKLNDKKANALHRNVYQDEKRDKPYIFSIEEEHSQKAANSKSGNQDITGRRLMLGKRQVVPEEEGPDESKAYREVTRNEVRNHKEIYAPPQTSYHHIKPEVMPVKERNEPPYYGEFNPDEAETYNQPNSSYSAYLNVSHKNPEYSNVEANGPIPISSHREFNPRVPVQGQFSPYYPSSNDVPVTDDFSFSKFDRKLSKLSSQNNSNLTSKTTFTSGNIQEIENEAYQSRFINTGTEELNQPNFDASENLNSEQSSRESKGNYVSNQISQKFSSDQDLLRSKKQVNSSEITREDRFKQRNSSEITRERLKQRNSSEITREDRLKQRNSSIESLDSNFSPNSDFLDLAFSKRAKNSSTTESSVVNAKSNKSYSQRDANEILEKSKMSSEERGHHHPSSLEESSRLIQSSKSPKRIRYHNESNPSSVSDKKKKDQILSLGIRTDKSISDFERGQKLLNKLVKEKVQRNRDVSIESEIRQKVDNQPLEYTLADESKRSFEELKNLVNEGLHIRSNSKTKTDQEILRGIELANKTSIVSQPSRHERTNKGSDSNNASGVEKQPKTSTVESNNISSVNQKNLRNSYYHIGKAKSCLETYLENSSQGYLNNSQTSLGSNKSKTNQSSANNVRPKFVYNHQNKFAKIKNLTPEEIIDSPNDSSYNSNFEKNIVKRVGIVRRLKSKTDNIERTPGEQIPQGNRLFQVWNKFANIKAAPKLKQKKGDWSSNHNAIISNNADPVLPPRSDSLKDHFDSSTLHSTHPASRSDQAHSRFSDSSSNNVKLPSYFVSPSYNSTQKKGRKLDDSLPDVELQAYKYAFDYYQDYYSKPNSTGAIDSIPPYLLNDTHSYDLEVNHSNIKNSNNFRSTGLNTWNQNNTVDTQRSSHSIVSPSPDFSNLIDSNLDANTTGNNIPGFNAPENITYTNAHHDYWSRITTRNTVNPGMSKHYSHSLGAVNHSHIAVNTAIQTNTHALDTHANTVNMNDNRQYPHDQEVPINIVNYGWSRDMKVPASNVTSDSGKKYSYRAQQKKSKMNTNIHYSYTPGGLYKMNTDTNKYVNHEQSINSEVNIHDTTVSNNKKLNDNLNTSEYEGIDESDSGGTKYSPSGLRVYDKEHRSLTQVPLGVKGEALNEHSLSDFKEKHGRMYKSNEKSTMNSQRKQTLKPISESVGNNTRGNDGFEQVPPELFFKFSDNFKKGFTLSDLPKNLSGYFQKIVSWKNTKDNNFGEGVFSRGAIDPRNASKEIHHTFAEIPTSKENVFEKFTKPIFESINRNVDSYYVKSVFGDNPVKSIPKGDFTRKVTNVGSVLDSDESNCTTCMKLSKLSSNIQSGVPFLKSKKLNYNLSKAYNSSIDTPQQNSIDMKKEKDDNTVNSQNRLQSNKKKHEQSDEKLFNNYSMPFIPTKSRVPVEFNIHEDLKAEELRYLNPHITNKTITVKNIKPNTISKLKAITEKKPNSYDKKRAKIQERSKVTYVSKKLAKKLKSALSSSKVVTKPTLEADLKSNLAPTTKLSDSKERMTFKKNKLGDAVTNIVNIPTGDTDSKGKILKDNADIQEEPTVEKKQVENITKTSVQSVGETLSDIISTSSKTVMPKIKRSSPAHVKSEEAVNINTKSPQVEQGPNVNNSNKTSKSEKSGAAKSLVKVLKKFSYTDRKENPYKAFSDLYSN